MTRSRPLAAIIALTALAALAGCVREGPPAPLSFPGAQARSPAPPPALVPQEHLPHPGRIVVAKGDTLYTISRHYDVPLRSIIDANNLDPPFQVAAGTTLVLPQERFHVVQPGDTLYGISRLYGVEISTLASLNSLSAPYALHSGQTLYLPASVEPPEKSPPAAAPAVATAPAVPNARLGSPPPEKPGAPPTAKAAQAGTLPAPPPEAPKFPPRIGKGFDWPVQGRIIGRYGTGPNGTHNDGINIAAREGEPVRAADAGVVAYAGNELRGYGNLVLIKHSGGYMTAYAHNSQLLVKRGEVVKRGQEIAKAGSTGTVDTPQVHFEIRQGTRTIDPASLLPSLSASAK
ncbi:MAG TPA: peptidoglycan DD-metalloendopeptidase family protein [Stellaceae bacterium]|nr:peptidoglycan DD-metalloendopeptidase family protein [Stellaceae bacterium]